MNVIDYLNAARKTVAAVVGFVGTGIATDLIGKQHAEQVITVGGVVTSALVYLIANLPKWQAEAKRVREVFVPQPDPAPEPLGPKVGAVEVPPAATPPAAPSAPHPMPGPGATA